MAEKITVETTIDEPIEKVWEFWTKPEHITKWCNASPDWHTPRAENDLSNGGKFMTRMEAKDGSTGFDFIGTYTAITPLQHIGYRMDDGRQVTIDFVPEGERVKIIETFDPEGENSLEIQHAGWQAILESFKKYVESH